MNRTNIAILTVIIFLIGAATIIYYGRPVMKIEDAQTSTVGTNTISSPTSTTNDGGASGTRTKTYTLTDIASHATEADCWSAINGSVYDLSSWVSRHPGGSRPIIGLCGKDGSAGFNRKHGGEARPTAALVLLKIGELAQ